MSNDERSNPPPTLPSKAAKPSFQCLLEFDEIRRDNHCDAICAYAEDCECFKELNGTAEWQQ